VRCGASLRPATLACPSCGALLHGEELKLLANEAEAETAAGQYAEAMETWRRAILLLPPGSRQHAQIMERVNELASRVRANRDPALAQASKKPTGWLAGLGTLGLILWKFKFILLFLLTKGKLLLLGLTKASTLLSMFAAFGLYWMLWGWQFGLGFVLSIYVHEMGHVFAFRRYGIPSSAPMFIPGFGAFVRGRVGGANEVEAAHISLAGPLWGGVASLASLGLYHAMGHEIFAALTQVSARINLLNLLPFSILDGGKALGAISRRDRWLIAGTGLLAAVLSGEFLVLLVAGSIAFRAFEKDVPEHSDREAFLTWTGLLLALSFLAAVHVPAAHRP
jgi:Zn-dependent protease